GGQGDLQEHSNRGGHHHPWSPAGVRLCTPYHCIMARGTKDTEFTCDGRVTFASPLMSRADGKSGSRTGLKTRAGGRPLNLRQRKKMLKSQRLPGRPEAALAIRWCRGGKGGRNAQEVPVMRDYAETVKNFSAADLERRTLAGSLGGGVNACIE